jgi:tripeptide aminopeptidase
MRLGRIDAETTANIGLIEGGVAVNIVPNSVILRGEARSHDEQKLSAQTEHMIRCLQEAAAAHEITVGEQRHRASVEPRVDRDYDALNVADDSALVRLVRLAGKNLGIEVQTQATGGGCDANVLNKKGLEVANLSTGMRDIHTVKEWLDLKDLYVSAAMVFEIVRLNAQEIR